MSTFNTVSTSPNQFGFVGAPIDFELPWQKTINLYVDDAQALLSNAATRWAVDKAVGVLQDNGDLPKGWSSASLAPAVPHFQTDLFKEIAKRLDDEVKPPQGPAAEPPHECQSTNGEKRSSTIWKEGALKASDTAGGIGLTVGVIMAIARNPLAARASQWAQFAHIAKPVATGLAVAAGLEGALTGMEVMHRANLMNDNCPPDEPVKNTVETQPPQSPADFSKESKAAGRITGGLFAGSMGAVAGHIAVEALTLRKAGAKDGVDRAPAPLTCRPRPRA